MQHYVDPNTVRVPPETRWPSKKLKEILEVDGQIVPILVRKHQGHEDTFTAADGLQGERVLALQELEWDTILIEDEWTEDDL